jgi:hypothetical protein
MRQSHGAAGCSRWRALLVLVAVVVGDVGSALGDDGRRWWRGDWKEEFWDGPCEVKIESKRGEFKREVKCPDGVGAGWRGEWKKEFRDGPCLVKQEAKRDEYKEEVKCDRPD